MSEGRQGFGSFTATIVNGKMKPVWCMSRFDEGVGYQYMSMTFDDGQS
jgi:hypothetical protein